MSEREFPIEFKHENGHVLVARNEQQAQVFEKHGFKEVEKKKKRGA